MDDIPKGAFICTYAGLLLTEEQSDIRGAQYGDEYFAELDFLQCLKSLNNESDQMDETSSNANTYDHDENSSSSCKNMKHKNETSSKLNDSYQRPNKKQSSYNKRKDKEENEQDDIIFLDSDEDEQDLNRRNQQLTSQRENELNQSRILLKQQKDKTIVTNIQSSLFFTNKENRFFYKDYLENTQEAYIMDAKSWGNIGRWFNHSCSPNIFVQNVFIDTYDLKFPWIAFFSLQTIKAGTELCCKL